MTPEQADTLRQTVEDYIAVRTNTTPINTMTNLPMDVNHVLLGAVNSLENAVVCGFGLDEDFYFASSWPDAPNVIYALEKSKFELLRTVEQLESGES